MKISRLLHPEYREETERVLSSLLREYPRVSLRSVEVFDRPGDRSMGFATGDHTINLNGHWYSKPRSFFRTAVVEARRTTPPGFPLWHGGIGGIDQEYERLLVHEYGHLVAAVTSGSTRVAKTLFKKTISEPDLAVSGYSLVDEDECFAEVFDALHFKVDENPLVAEMHHFLDRTR